jgi:hypothetical protein
MKLVPIVSMYIVHKHTYHTYMYEQMWCDLLTRPRTGHMHRVQVRTSNFSRVELRDLTVSRMRSDSHVYLRARGSGADSAATQQVAWVHVAHQAKCL